METKFKVGDKVTIKNLSEKQINMFPADIGWNVGMKNCLGETGQINSWSVHNNSYSVCGWNWPESALELARVEMPASEPIKLVELRKYSLGDRVAIYTVTGSRQTGRISTIEAATLAGTAKIYHVQADGDAPHEFRVHEKQLRRLVKKEPEVFYVDPYYLAKEPKDSDAIKVKVIK